jgi:nitrate/nitrite-specific signal transduction histidine kinase
MLLLIAQEAISNALRHAKPTVFNVSVRATHELDAHDASANFQLYISFDWA